MSAHNDGGPAFPQGGVWDGDRNQVNPVGAYFDAGGMSLRAYAAIQLRVPESGIDWLDAMIQRAMNLSPDRAATVAYDHADALYDDALLAERERKP